MRFTRNTRRAAVLGCGPAGLFAAHGLVQNGWDVTIFSKKRKSHLYGAQYLHAPIPGLTPDDAVAVDLKYVLVGDVEEYRKKVYGVNEVATSPELLGQEHQAWDIREAYDAAWDLYSDRIENLELNPEALGIFKYDPNAIPVTLPQAIDLTRFHSVISSIPMPELCYKKDLHQFHSVKVWAMGDAPERGQHVPYRPAENTVECNGSRDTGWYRAANVFGHSTVEWPAGHKPPLPGIAEATKPLWSDCNCYRDGIFSKPFHAVGRYGRWLKGVLTHHSYATAVSL